MTSTVLVLLMIYRPRGIMGFCEFSWLIPPRRSLGPENGGKK